jgi:pyruvate/oxaloacetate carboxyltransferase
MGADSICIKDMAGLLKPYDAYSLVKALKENVKVPIQLHTHYTAGLASMTILKAVEAGVDIIDTAMSPLAMGTSQPPTEPIVASLAGTQYDTGLSLEKLDKAYEEGIISQIFTTNLVYRMPELLEREWYTEVNMCKYISYIIDTLNHDQTISHLLDQAQRIHNVLDRYNSKK